MSFTKNLYAYSASFLPDQQKTSDTDTADQDAQQAPAKTIRLSDYRDRKTHGYVPIEEAEPTEENLVPTVLEKAVTRSKRNITIIAIAVFLALLGVFPILFGTVNIFAGAENTVPEPSSTVHSPESSIHASPALLAEEFGTSFPAQIYVYLTGEVNKTGILRLPEGARLFDAIQAASGLTDGAAGEFINLARTVEDGEHIHIFSKAEVEALDDTGEVPPTLDILQAGNATGSTKINVNTATAAELQELPGIGPALSSRIIDFRDKHGKFRDLTALGAVSGIGPKMLENLSELVNF